MGKNKTKIEIFNEIIVILKDLNKKYPNQDILRHISDATAEHQSLWGISNKEFLFSLEKYQATMYLPDEDEIAKIVEDGKKLGKGGYPNSYDDLYIGDSDLEY